MTQVQFYNTHCVIIENKSKEVVGVGKAYQGLYYLVDHVPGNISENWLKSVPHTCLQSNSAAAQTTPITPSEFDKWYHRLGHASTAKLKLITCVKPFLDQPSKVCITCPMSKFVELLFPLSESCAKTPFDLIHIDIWGPYRVCTRVKFKHFLTIVDEFICFSISLTLYLLLRHETFVQYTKSQFKGEVKVIRSDNALEFDDDFCKKLFQKCGHYASNIVCEKATANARVERKHRHILEVARSLRFQTGLPLRYWGECVMAAVYIINRLPTLVLVNKTPYECLFNEPPDYNVMKIFGCLAFACNPTNSGDEFAPTGVPCIFMGYPT